LGFGQCGVTGIVATIWTRASSVHKITSNQIFQHLPVDLHKLARQTTARTDSACGIKRIIVSKNMSMSVVISLCCATHVVLEGFRNFFFTFLSFFDLKKRTQNNSEYQIENKVCS
jgi:hypothetical protein